MIRLTSSNWNLHEPPCYVGTIRNKSELEASAKNETFNTSMMLFVTDKEPTHKLCWE